MQSVRKPVKPWARRRMFVSSLVKRHAACTSISRARSVGLYCSLMISPGTEGSCDINSLPIVYPRALVGKNTHLHTRAGVLTGELACTLPAPPPLHFTLPVRPASTCTCPLTSSSFFHSINTNQSPQHPNPLTFARFPPLFPVISLIIHCINQLSSTRPHSRTTSVRDIRLRTTLRYSDGTALFTGAAHYLRFQCLRL